MDARNRFGQSLTPERATDAIVCVLTAGVILVLLQSLRVFMPYLVFEIDQSERETLAKIAVTVFALGFVGAILARIVKLRATLAITVGVLVIGRLGFQLTESPAARWQLAATAIVASLWALISLLPNASNAVGYGIGFAFLLDLIVRALRGTLDLPWMPGAIEHLLTLVILVAVVLAAYQTIRFDALSPSEMPLAPTARFIGLGSGLALWLVAAGNIGFGELRSELSIPGAFSLQATGVLLALVAVASSLVSRNSRRESFWLPLAMGLIGALVVLAWQNSWSRWLDLAGVLVFAFVVTLLTMQAANGSTPFISAGRWRTAAALTTGMLLQAGFVFLYSARTGPMQLFMAPLAVLTISALVAAHFANAGAPKGYVVQRVIAVASIAAILTFGWLLYDEPELSYTSAETTALTVMTYNIQEGFSNDKHWNLEETARTIEASDPDIVLLQEITRGWLPMSSVDQVRWLAERLGMDYAYAGNSYDGLWGNAILSRVPIVSTDSIVFSTTDNLRRGAVAIEVDTADGPMRVISTHLDNPRAAIDTRLEQIAELIAFWGGSTPAIVAGDFNADPGSAEWQAMIDAGFVDVGEGTSETTSEDERRIDYIFVTPDMAVTSYAVPEVWTADHRPVVVELGPTS